MIYFEILPEDTQHLAIKFTDEAKRDRSLFDRLVTFCRGFKERAFKFGVWVVPLNRETLEHLEANFTESEYFVTDEAKFMLGYLKITQELDARRSSKRYSYIFDGKDTDFVPITNIHPAHDENGIRFPFAHQAVAVESALNYPYFAYLMEMGTGKTPCPIWEANEYALKLKAGEQLRILIVCPKSLRMNWLNEFKKNFIQIIPYELRILEGQLNTLELIVELLRSSFRVKIAIVSYDSALRMEEALILFAPTMVVMDESHYCKSPDSKRYKTLMKIVHFESVKYRRILTGTPVSNNLLDLWSQFQLIQPGILGYNTFQGFKREFCNIVKIDNEQGEDFDKITGFKNVEDLKTAMARVSFIVKKDRCLTLPERLYQTSSIEMPEQVRAYYNQLINELTITVGNTKATADWIIVQMLKLSQICSGFIAGHVYTDDEREYSVTPIPGGDAKLAQMLEDSQQVVEESKLIIWARFRYDIEMISRQLTKKGITNGMFYGGTKDKEREEMVRRFNEDSKFRVLVMHTAAGGVGLTLLGNQNVDKDKCKTSFFYSSDFSYGRREQAEARNHRIGQRNPVLYRDYVYEDSIEETIAAALQSKRDLSEGIKDITMLENILKGNIDAFKPRE